MGCDIHSIAQIEKDGKWVTVKRGIADDPRSYDTFSLLAGVRGPEGFKDPVGLPSNIKLDNYAYESFFLGEHSHSYYTLSELKAYLKEEPRERMLGFLEEEEFLRVKGTEELPEDYHWEVPEGYTELSIQEYNNSTFESLPRQFVIRYAWYETRSDRTVLQEIVKELSQISRENGNCEVRYIFGFDS